MAIDKAADHQGRLSGRREAAKTLIPTTMWSYNDKIVDYPFDPKTKVMLQTAGVATPRH